MKKTFSAIFLLVILSFILLTLSGWYFAASAEQAFKGYLQKNSEGSARQVFRLELLDYRKSIFGAKAKLKVSSDIPIIAEKMGELELIAKLLNGPIFITKSGISVGSSRWFITLNKSALIDIEKENIHAVFLDSLPKFIVRTDFKKNVHYSAKFQANFAEVNVDGVVDSIKENNSGTIILQGFRYDFSQNRISAKQVSINYHHQKRITAAYKLGKTVIKIPKLLIKTRNLTKPIELSLDATSNIGQTSGYLNGYSKINLRLISNKRYGQNEIPIDKASLSLMLKGLPSEGFLRYSELEAEINNLKQQAQWSLEEAGEFPEGQDRIWQLYDNIDESSQRLPSIILNEMFNEESLIQLKIKTFNSSGRSELMGNLRSIDKSLQQNTAVNKQDVSAKVLINDSSHFRKQSKRSLKKGGDGFNTLISNLQGKAQVKLDSDLFLFLQNFLPIKQSDFKLVLKDSKLLMQ